MVKTKFKKAVSLVLAAVMSLTAFMGIGATTAFAAVGEKADVYLVDYPRSGDTNNNGEWGHGNLNYMNGWKGLSTKYTGLRAMGSYSGNIAYCIEPGTGQRTGDTLTEKDENFFNNISPNGTISGDDIRLLIGRILQYGYIGSVNDERLWKHINAALKKTFGLWIYNTDRTGDVRCLCPKCLSDYIHDPNYVVRRFDPFAKSKDNCDKCNNSGWDYIVFDKRTSVKGKGCRNVK